MAPTEMDVCSLNITSAALITTDFHHSVFLALQDQRLSDNINRTLFELSGLPAGPDACWVSNINSTRVAH